jgi:hypothetical protein
MGPMAGHLGGETDSRHAARRVFRFGLCGGLLFRLDDPVVLRHQWFWETSPLPAAQTSGLALSLFILVAYTAWRGEKGLAGVPAALMAGLPIWGRNVADGPAFRPRLLPRRHAQGDGRRLQDHHHADVHHRQRAAVRPCPDVRAHSPGDHRPDGRLRLHLVHLPDRGQHPAVDRRPVHGTVGPAADRGAGGLPDRHGTRRRSDASRHHHGGQHGDRHDHAADRAQPVRHLRHHRHEPGPGGARRAAVRGGAAPVPDHRDLCAGDLHMVALQPDGAGDRDRASDKEDPKPQLAGRESAPFFVWGGGRPTSRCRLGTASVPISFRDGWLQKKSLLAALRLPRSGAMLPSR